MSSIRPTPTSHFQLIIDHALSDYAKQTGIDLADNPFAARFQLSNSPDSILDLLQEREKAFKEYRERNRTLISCISPAVKVLHAFSITLGEAISLVPFSPAKAIFVGIDVVLDATNGVSSSYDALLDLFDCMGNFLKRLEIYTNIPPTPIMMDVIVKIMVELLLVLGLATKQIKQGRFKKFTKKLLGDNEVEAVLRRLDRLTQDEARMTIAQTLEVVHGLVNDIKVVIDGGKASMNSIRQALGTMKQVINEVNSIRRDQLQRDVKTWLSPPDPSTNHDMASEAHHSGTTAWFFQSSAFVDWKANGSLLWIYGKPGSGKSTLLSTIIEDIEGMHAAGLATMAYYYFDFRDVEKQNRYGLLASLLSQLCAESDPFYKVLARLYSAHASGTRKPTGNVLTKCLKEMLRLPGQGPIYIIVDALDECPNTSGMASARERVLELVKELVDLNLRNVHLCVTSRPEIDIQIALKPLTSLQVSLHDESGQKDDIIKYIKSVVHSDRTMRRWRKEDKQLVIDVLSGRADGMFRWVVCQIDRLRRSFPASIESALASLPETLDETYEQTLLGIDQEKREYAQRLFRCLTISIRPLRVEELAEILAVQFDEMGHPMYNADWRPTDAEEAVLSACSSLISIVTVDGIQVVQFSHFSVQEFLTSERLAKAEERLSYYHTRPEPAHSILAHASLSVLLQLDDQIDRNTIRHFPLALYASRHWVDHVQFRNVSSHVEEVMERLFNPAKTHFAAWVWLYDIDRHWVEPMSEMHPTRPLAGPLYYAASCGFHCLVERLLVTHSLNVNSKGGTHRTALHAASIKGHLEVASLLLKNDADPDSRDHDDRTPLHQVSRVGYKAGKSAIEIVQLLLNSGANVDVSDSEGWTPLHMASQSGCYDIAELLLASGARLDTQDKHQNTPLMLACSDGRLDVSRLLIDRGSHLAAQNKAGHTLLHLASARGHLDMAKLIIERGADVDSRNYKQETPLDRASARGYLDMARFLVERGASVLSRDQSGWTPLHTASYCGHLHIVKFLLEFGIDVNIRSGRRETLLHVASITGKLDVVHFLIEKGTDIYARDNRGRNPLHIAAQYGHVDVVRLLIDTGNIVDLRSRDEKTPLVFASNRGKVEVSRFLIERGADSNARDNRRWAPIHFASRAGHFEMVQLLLDCGVDPNVQNDDLEYPLHLASAYDHLKVVNLLVQRAAKVDIFNDVQKTPLDLAAGNGKVEIVRLLIDHGANLHSGDCDGGTPLHTASRSGHLDVVRLLLTSGADVKVVNKANKTATELASENNKVKVARFLVEYKSDTNVRNQTLSSALDTTYDGANEGRKGDINHLLLAASEEEDVEVVKLLLEQGADINARNTKFETPLDRAAFKGNVEIVCLLLERGAEVDPRDEIWCTPLRSATRHGYVEVMRLLIKRGAKVDSRDKDGWTPLHLASRDGYVEVARLLIDHGANVNAQQLHHQTPLHLSALNGHLEVAKLLLEHGANVHTLNIQGESPLQLSLTWGYRKVADLLRGHYSRGV